ncbi:hypothetical protein RRG08_052939 [Elysia crispata]|uniref:Tetraspanin n=1 Tax=Elysia crispata TaxID=231223 RepID=A0AAE1BCS1_9GAST|nr:hypothetical protein RRG08_052939 [Elysia crispata]
MSSDSSSESYRETVASVISAFSIISNRVSIGSQHTISSYGSQKDQDEDAGAMERLYGEEGRSSVFENSIGQGGNAFCCYTFNNLLLGPMSDLISFISKIVVVVVNFFLLVISVVLASLGFYTLTGNGFLKTLFDKAEQTYLNTIKSYNIQGVVTPEDFVSMVKQMAYSLVGIGIWLGTMSLTGCCGGCMGHQKMLKTYSRTLFFLLLIEIIAVAFVYEGKSVGKQRMVDSLQGFGGVAINNSVSRRWNIVMTFLQCCGVDNHGDFQGLPNWPPAKVAGKTVNLQTPIACCKGSPKNFSCATKGTASPQVNNMNTGCYDIIFDKIFHNRITIAGLVLLLLFHVVVLCCCAWILLNMEPDDT